MAERENWPFLKVAVSPKPERLRPPNLVCMHLISMHTCMNFLSQFRSIKNFDDHTIVHGQNGKIGRFEGSSISETGEALPTKIGVHAFDINLCLHEFFEPIPIDQIF